MGNASANLAPAFTADTAAKTGQSERSVQRDATRGDRIAPDVLRVVAGTSLDTGASLDKIARLPVEQQRRVASRISASSILRRSFPLTATAASTPLST
jgi:ParB family transcriptional regulator, chromosome partitioning protein